MSDEESVQDDKSVQEPEPEPIPMQQQHPALYTPDQILAHVYDILELSDEAVVVLQARGVVSVRTLIQLQRVQLDCFTNQEP